MVRGNWRLLLVTSLFSFASCVTACTPFNKKMDSWVGRSIDQWLAIPDKGTEKLEEVRGPDEEGNKIYVIWIEKKCRVFHTVNAQGIITAWRSEGSACKHYWQ